MMAAFVDMQCGGCGRRFGWSGDPTDAPPCPRCGAKPDATAMAEDAAEIERFRDFLRRRDELRAATERSRRVREDLAIGDGGGMAPGAGT